MTESPMSESPGSSEPTSERGTSEAEAKPPGSSEPTSERGTSEAEAKPQGSAPIVAWWVGLAAHLVIGIWYAASGLVAPPWAVVVLLAIWVVVLIVGLRLRTRRPWWMLAVPVLDVAIWVAVISAGETFLGWTA